MSMNNKKEAPQYLQLNRGGALARMGILRMLAAQTTARDSHMPPSLPLADWRAARQWTFVNWSAAYGALSQGYDMIHAERRTVWYCHTGEQFRNERDAHEFRSHVTHTGWYCDDDCSSLAIGIVARLTHGRFIAGLRLTDTNERTYLGTIYTDELTAAIAADRHAELYAEDEKEHSEKYREAESLKDEIADKSKDVARMFALRNTSGFDDAACYRELEDGIEELRNLRDDLATNYKGF